MNFMLTTTKICGHCNKQKHLSDFNFQNKKLNILESICRECSNKKSKLYYLNNKDKIISKRDHDKLKIYRKNYYAKNRDSLINHSKNYYLNNKQTMTIKRRAYQATKKFKDNRNTQRKERLKNDPAFKIRLSLKNRIWFALKGIAKSNKTLDLLGCNLEFLKKHLEEQFTEGMNWNNYGFNGWHIDHKIPYDAFDLTKEENQRKCFHYSNLQPLWAIDNIKKSNKIINVS